jgi:FG-GAP repeat
MPRATLLLLFVSLGTTTPFASAVETGNILAEIRAFVKAPAVSVRDDLGIAVAISGDRAIVGAPGEDSSIPGIVMYPNGTEAALTDAGAPGSGAAYILERNASTDAWFVAAFVKPPAVSANDEFGWTVSISGDSAIVGAYRDDSSVPGIVMYPNGTEAALRDSSAENSGAAYILERKSSTGAWTMAAFVKAPVVLANNEFGWSASISGNRAVIGAPGQSSGVPGVVMNPDGTETALKDQSASGSGAAYIIERSSSGAWFTSAFVKAPVVSSSLFGGTVSISGDRVIIGARHESSSIPGIVMHPDGSESALWDTGADVSGAAYILECSSSTHAWVVVAFVKPPAVSRNTKFSWASAISGDRAIIGAQREASSVPGITMNPRGTELALTDQAAPNSGAAYILERSSATGAWSTVAFVKPPAVSPHYYFGWSVSIAGDRASVGSFSESSSIPGIVMNPTGNESALTDRNAGVSGAAYIFDRNSSTGTWFVRAFVKPPAVSGGDQFAYSVSICGDHAIIGAPAEDSSVPGILMTPNGTEAALTDSGTFNAGAAYVLVLPTRAALGTTGSASATDGSSGVARTTEGTSGATASTSGNAGTTATPAPKFRTALSPSTSGDEAPPMFGLELLAVLGFIAGFFVVLVPLLILSYIKRRKGMSPPTTDDPNHL